MFQITGTFKRRDSYLKNYFQCPEKHIGKVRKHEKLSYAWCLKKIKKEFYTETVDLKGRGKETEHLN